MCNTLQQNDRQSQTIASRKKKVAVRDQKNTIIDGNQSQFMRAMHYGLWGLLEISLKCSHEILSLAGLDKMYSLTDLNLSENYFTDVGTVLTLGELPCLEILDFRDNAMTREPLYRVRVFTAFDDRAEQVDKSFNNLRWIAIDRFSPDCRSIDPIKKNWFYQGKNESSVKTYT